MNLYTSDGWINAKPLKESKAPFVVAVGGRGIGKTYGLLKELVEGREKFIYLRRTQTQIDACKVPELSPFAALCRDIHVDITSKSISKYIAGFFIQDEKPFLLSIGVALSTFSNIRGFDAGEYDYILFDEFIPERHERPFPHEGEAFLNVLETVGRNRELQGKQPVKVILLSNSNKIDSPILNAIGALKPFDRMVKSDREYGEFYNGDLEIYRYTKSPISEKKADTALYRIANNKDFSEMALQNSFGEDTFLKVISKPINEYSPLVSVMGITIFKHKSSGEIYVVDGIKGDNVIQGSDEIILRGFRRRYFFLSSLLMNGKVFYSSTSAKIIFENIWR